MADSIPREFAEKLITRLGITKRHLNRTITSIAASKHVSRRAAAFLLAFERGINYQKYATPDDLAEMRAARSGGVAIPATLSASYSSEKPAVRPIATVKAPTPIKQTKNNSLFVVHGRDKKLNEAFFALLRALGLNPMEWSQAIDEARGANPNVSDTINKAMKRVQGVVVLFSPDEDAKLKSKFCDPKEKSTAGKLSPQSRPNVIFEAGLALGAHPGKTLLVQVGDVRPITDIAGMHILQLSNSSASRNQLAQRLRKLKLKVKTTGTSWLTEGDLDR